MAITIQIRLAQEQGLELTSGNLPSRRVDWPEVESLTAEADKEYFGEGRLYNDLYLPSYNELEALGKRLFSWLDGPAGWLRAGLEAGETVVLLDLAAPLQSAALNPKLATLVKKLAHLPWELLYDSTGFLAGRGIETVRLVGSRQQSASPANRPLRLLFMATSPEDVEPLLNYEHEEAAILDATNLQPIDLVVEESGSVSQLQNLVASFEPGHFDAFHLTGHGAIENGTPVFVTENEFGKPRWVMAEELADAFGKRWPRLLFLSGCHTAQAPGAGMVPSMAQALVTAGAEMVLGWARPVLDSTATAAAGRIYRALSTGEPLVSAVAATRRELLREWLKDPERINSADWHLLRIYQGAREPLPLVTPLNTLKRERLKRRPAESEFLDAQGIVKVAGSREFVGRRREMQRALRALSQTSSYHGVFLHGLGGYGKSTIAARLCRRHEALMDGVERVVLVGPVDEARLRQRLHHKFGSLPDAIEALNRPKVALKHQLAELIRTLEDAGRSLLLVLDDFEQNIPHAHIEDGSFRLVTPAWEVFEALCFAIEEAAAASRLIVTCRYHHASALPKHNLHVEGLGAMRPTDFDKKARALLAREKTSAPNAVREAKIRQAAAGNPRLLERLSALITRTDLVNDAFLDQLVQEVSRFRENILAKKLLAALSGSERKMLARLAIFELPVPLGVVTALADGAPLEPAVGLGVLERETLSDEELYRVSGVFASLLDGELSQDEWHEARTCAAQEIHQSWYKGQERTTENRLAEVVRVALLVTDQEIAAAVAEFLATLWINANRFKEAVALCRSVLHVLKDYRVLGALARAEEVLGEVQFARQHYQEALAQCPANEESRRSANLHNLASLFANAGDVPGAMNLWQQSLEISRRIGDLRARAASLANMAVQLANQGDASGALQLWDESLALVEQIGDVRGKAAVLHQMAGVVCEQGDSGRAFDLWQTSLDIKQRLGDVFGSAATIQNMACAAMKQGDRSRAEAAFRLAAKVLGPVHAYFDLVTVLGNLALAVENDCEKYSAQSVWLALRLQLPIKDKIREMQQLFEQLPPAHPAEALLGTAAGFLLARTGEGDRDHDSRQDDTGKMLSIAASHAGIHSQEEFDRWFTDNRLNDPSVFIPRLYAHLEEIVGDTWLFDRTPLLNRRLVLQEENRRIIP